MNTKWKNIFVNYVSDRILVPKTPKVRQKLETESYNQEMDQKFE